jgi:hypothetical protein
LIDKSDLNQLLNVIRELTNQVARVAFAVEAKEINLGALRDEACPCCGCALVPEVYENCPACRSLVLK